MRLLLPCAWSAATTAAAVLARSARLLADAFAASRATCEPWGRCGCASCTGTPAGCSRPSRNPNLDATCPALLPALALLPTLCLLGLAPPAAPKDSGFGEVRLDASPLRCEEAEAGLPLSGEGCRSEAAAWAVALAARSSVAATLPCSCCSCWCRIAERAESSERST